MVSRYIPKKVFGKKLLNFILGSLLYKALKSQKVADSEQSTVHNQCFDIGTSTTTISLILLYRSLIGNKDH